MIRTVVLAVAIASVAACSPGHGHRAPMATLGTPAAAQVAPCSWTDACDPDDNAADRNCIVAGNCGPEWVQVEDTEHPETWIAMIRGDHHGYDPYRCLVHVAATTTVVCQDGWMETS